MTDCYGCDYEHRDGLCCGCGKAEHAKTGGTLRATGEGLAEALATGRYYNGYASQDDFHAALSEGNTHYVVERRKSIEANGAEGWRHADCDHAYGICSG